MRKKSFVLLEVMIAISLVTMVILPFFHYPFQHMKKELKLLFEMELERHAQNTLTNLHTDLLQKKFPSGQIFKVREKNPPPYIDTTVTIELSPGYERKYDEKIFVDCLKTKDTDHQNMVSFIHFTVQYRERKKGSIILQAESSAIAKKKKT